MDKKNIAYLNRRAPYGSSYALEALESALAGAAFEQCVSLVFVDDGVYQLLNAQNPRAIAMKNLAKVYRVLGDYGIEQIYVAHSALLARTLTEKALIPLVCEDEQGNEKSLICMMDDEQISALLSRQDAVLSF